MDKETPRTNREKWVLEWTEMSHWPRAQLASLLNETLPVPQPFCVRSEWGATGERVGVSLLRFCLPFLPCWLVNNLLLPPTRRPTMCLLSDADHLMNILQIDPLYFT